MTGPANKCAIVTGAGSGIGRATAVQLAREGWRIALVGRTESKLRDTEGQIGIAGATFVFAAELLDPEECGHAVRVCGERLGRIDALCNVAGYAPMAPLAQTSDEVWRRTMGTNLDALFFLTRAAWPWFARQRGGVVVNISSVASVDPYEGFAAYAPSKAAVNMLTRITAVEGSAIGLKAVTVAPGAVETPMLRAIFDEAAIPKRETLGPERVAKLIVDCVTGRRAFEPGEVIFIRPGEE